MDINAIKTAFIAHFAKLYLYSLEGLYRPTLPSFAPKLIVDDGINILRDIT